MQPISELQLKDNLRRGLEAARKGDQALEEEFDRLHPDPDPEPKTSQPSRE
jgi:hypothetical protein